MCTKLFPQHTKLCPVDLLNNTGSDVTSCNLNNSGIQVRNLFAMVQGLWTLLNLSQRNLILFLFFTEVPQQKIIIRNKLWSVGVGLNNQVAVFEKRKFTEVATIQIISISSLHRSLFWFLRLLCLQLCTELASYWLSFRLCPQTHTAIVSSQGFCIVWESVEVAGTEQTEEFWPLASAQLWKAQTTVQTKRIQSHPKAP